MGVELSRQVLDGTGQRLYLLYLGLVGGDESSDL